MTFFESLLALLLVAILLLQLARRLSLPYPAMLAGAGVIVAMIPHAPSFSIDPATCLALFIAPAVVDAAFDFPPGATRRFVVPLTVYAVVAVLLTTAVVAWISWAILGLPIAAGITLGAVVSPPDAAAATAVLRKLSLSHKTDAVLKGESLFNDATALLLFSGALTVLERGGLNVSTAVRLGFAAPGGLLLGIACGRLYFYIVRLVKDTLGGVLLQFVTSYVMWITAQHLGLSAVLCVIAFAMTLASRLDPGDFNARMRVESYAVWTAVVFTLNVLAFLLMGMQARSILLRMQGPHLRHSLEFAGLVIVAIVITRMIVVLGYTYWENRHEKSPDARNEAIFMGWCGMRGFVTLATAFALPENFPHRDTAVLTAFAVALATLVLQGLTIAPLVRKLGLDRSLESVEELASARVALAQRGLESVAHEEGPEAENLRYRLSLKLRRCLDRGRCGPLDQMRTLGLKAIEAERTELEKLRSDDKVSATGYLDLQEQLDWTELTLLSDSDRRIEEI